MKKVQPKLTGMEQKYFDLLSAGDIVLIDDFKQLHANWDNNIVAVNMMNLRRKLVDSHNIESIRGKGYKMHAI